jgi:hypothetical protein
VSILERWLNPYYLDPATRENIRQSVLAKPGPKYAVLDNFFRTEMLDELIRRHPSLAFNEEIDRRAPDGSWLPYDGAVVFAEEGKHFGSELFFALEWHRYLMQLVDCRLPDPIGTEVKLRWHRPDAGGFWIHTDRGDRAMVVIAYFNRGWQAQDGGLLQLWRVDEGQAPGVVRIDNVDATQRLDMLTKYKRIRTATPGGGFPDRQTHDLVLIDQVVPVYNRVFICNYQHDPAYHSVTPSNGKERTGFVQWLGAASGRTR